VPVHPIGSWRGNGVEFYFDAKSDLAKLNQQLKESGDIAIDYDHGTHCADYPDYGSCATKENLTTDVAGWVTEFEVDQEFLYAVVKWELSAAKEILDGKHRYISSAFSYETIDGVGRILEMHSLALVRRPGTEYQKRIGLSAKERTYIVEKKENTISLAVLTALGMKDAKETEAVVRIAELKKQEAELLALTATKTPEAAKGVLLAWKNDQAKLTALTAEVEAAKAEAANKEKELLLASLSSEGKITPAQLDEFKEWPLETLRSFSKVAVPITGDTSVSEPSSASNISTLSVSLARKNPKAFNEAFDQALKGAY